MAIFEEESVEHASRLSKVIFRIALLPINIAALLSMLACMNLAQSKPATPQAVNKQTSVVHSSPKIDQSVAALIEKMSDQKTEQQAFADLESLGCPAVPAIIERMDDRRKLPDRQISLRNKWGGFESIRFYGPEKIVDALAAILNQITGRGFGFIYNGAPDAARDKEVRAWRDLLHTTSEAKLCVAG